MKAISIIPEPKEVLLSKGSFSLDRNCVRLGEEIPELKREIRNVFGKTMPGSEIEELLKSKYTLEEERIREYCSKFRTLSIQSRPNAFSNESFAG